MHILVTWYLQEKNFLLNTGCGSPWITQYVIMSHLANDRNFIEQNFIKLITAQQLATSKPNFKKKNGEETHTLGGCLPSTTTPISAVYGASCNALENMEGRYNDKLHSNLWEGIVMLYHLGNQQHLKDHTKLVPLSFTIFNFVAKHIIIILIKQTRQKC